MFSNQSQLVIGLGGAERVEEFSVSHNNETPIANTTRPISHRRRFRNGDGIPDSSQEQVRDRRTKSFSRFPGKTRIQPRRSHVMTTADMHFLKTAGTYIKSVSSYQEVLFRAGQNL